MKTFATNRLTALVVLILAGLAATLTAPALWAQEGTAPAGTPDSAAAPPELEPAVDPDAPLVQRSLRIAGTPFKPRTSGPTQSATSGGGCYYLTGGSAAIWWNTPVYLPDGATAQYLRIYYNDTGAGDVWGYFTVYDLYGSVVQEWGISSSGTPGQGYVDTVLMNHVVDYNSYSYVVNVRLTTSDAAVQFCGVRIFYDY
ncbi:MAG: hypothetical protein F9K16_07420 [Thermoanaerobaculia bacterium]|nr:MAG: hypothetical protein F9K16_07420 [Thermoanaerobaculia bacterium]